MAEGKEDFDLDAELGAVGGDEMLGLGPIGGVDGASPEGEAKSRSKNQINPAEMPIRDTIALGLRKRALQVSPHLILLQRHFYEEHLGHAIARWMAWWLRSRNRLQTSQEEEQQAFKDAVKDVGDVSDAASLLLQVQDDIPVEYWGKAASIIADASVSAAKQVLQAVQGQSDAALAAASQLPIGRLGEKGAQMMQALQLMGAVGASALDAVRSDLTKAASGVRRSAEVQLSARQKQAKEGG